MFNPLRFLKGLWATPGAESSSDNAQVSPTGAEKKSTIPTSTSAATAAPVSTTSVIYPTLPDLNTEITAATPSINATASEASSPATQTNFPLPPQFPGGPPIRPIPSTSGVQIPQTPQTPIFGASAFGCAAYIRHPPSTNIVDVDMRDVSPAPPPTPPTTPPEEGDTPHSSTESPNQSAPRRATVEDDDTGDAPNNTSTSTPAAEGGNRPKLQPKRQQDFRHKSSPPQPKRRTSISSITIEKDNDEDPLPDGYSGTYHSIRFFTPDYSEDHSCGHLGEHKLICGHWIASEEPCGGNCKTHDWEHQPFVCPTCRDVVNDVIDNKLTASEKAKLDLFDDRYEAARVGYLVEYVTKRYPNLEGNITEMVLCLLYSDYGRACKASEGPVATLSVEEVVRGIQEMRTRDAQKRLERENPLNRHEKRKEIDHDGNAPSDADTLHATEAAVPSTTHKKQKRKLETHREPITSRTRGSKRPASFSETAVSGEDTNKKPRRKLEAHREPITPQTRGTKRKREADAQMETACETESNKRCRTAAELAGRDEDAQFDTRNLRATLNDFVWDGEEEL